MKKIIALFIAMVMVFTFVPAFAAGNVVDVSLEIVGKKANGEAGYMLKEGEEFTVAVMISENSHIQSGKFEINYNTEAISYVSHENGDVWDKQHMPLFLVNGAKSGRVIVPFAGNTETTEEGALHLFKFKMLDDAVNVSDITIKFTELFNKAGEGLVVSVQNIMASVYYDVTFVDFDGTVLSQQQVVKGDAAMAPVEPSRAGYKFIGWDRSFDEVTSDMTITALYEATGLLGDANLDGAVDSADATAVLRHVAQLDKLEGVAFANADVSKNGNVESDDATLILRFVANLITEF